MSITELQISESIKEDTEDETLIVTVSVQNNSSVDGHEVVQVYVRQLHPSLGRTVKELKGFKKVFVRANSKESINIAISKKRATSFRNARQGIWLSEKDTYQLLVGSSSEYIAQAANFEVHETQSWRGL
ncbi:hypothetical protein M752DRAFT_294889 [Aspergillus phoenicis ATCC 13157]|uniref:beta-glucosidase n=1 Tax=Aspergillus phoenicis ATCC 13157 TaxID=1353007 RepID=A0A370PGA4_ASPPH|nr:hypothetical protein CBS147346_5569 [Aspergillus niger]RDK41236.1 hypothetical protein M752DRAFT_294889 [Aspergillus phoenicis ATCC 13157]